MIELNLKLTVDEANVALEALGLLQYNRVKDIVGKIVGQANAQLADAEKAARAAAAAPKEA